MNSRATTSDHFEVLLGRLLTQFPEENGTFQQVVVYNEYYRNLTYIDLPAEKIFMCFKF